MIPDECTAALSGFNILTIIIIIILPLCVVIEQVLVADKQLIERRGSILISAQDFIYLRKNQVFFFFFVF